MPVAVTRTLEGHESARKRGKTIGGAGVTDDSMLSMALHLRGQEMSLRDIAKKLVITSGAKKGQHPSPATVMRMLREHDEQKATAPLEPTGLTCDSVLSVVFSARTTGTPSGGGHPQADQGERGDQLPGRRPRSGRQPGLSLCPHRPAPTHRDLARPATDREPVSPAGTLS